MIQERRFGLPAFSCSKVLLALTTIIPSTTPLPFKSGPFPLNPPGSFRVDKVFDESSPMFFFFFLAPGNRALLDFPSVTLFGSVLQSNHLQSAHLNDEYFSFPNSGPGVDIALLPHFRSFFDVLVSLTHRDGAIRPPLPSHFFQVCVASSLQHPFFSLHPNRELPKISRICGAPFFLGVFQVACYGSSPPRPFFVFIFFSIFEVLKFINFFRSPLTGKGENEQLTVFALPKITVAKGTLLNRLPSPD